MYASAATKYLENDNPLKKLRKTSKNDLEKRGCSIYGPYAADVDIIQKYKYL